MRRLRSPWTIVALVPVFFLAGFAVVTAMVDRGGGGRPEPAAQPLGTEAEDRPAAVVTGSDAAGDAPAAPAEPGPTSDDPRRARGGGRDGSAGPAARPRSSAGAGRQRRTASGPTEGRHRDRLRGLGWSVPDEEDEARRELRLGDRRAANVEIRGLFYDEERDPVGQGFWETDWAVGVSGLPVNEWLEMEVYGMVRHRATFAAIRVYKVTCG